MNLFDQNLHLILTAQEIEQEFLGLRWRGPGLYNYKNETLMVVPRDRTPEVMWYAETPRDEKFDVYVYMFKDWNPAQDINSLVNIPRRTDLV